jgi:hypothetical protein
MSDTLVSAAETGSSDGLRSVSPDDDGYDMPPHAAELPAGPYDDGVEREADMLLSICLRGTEHSSSPVLDFAREVNAFCRKVLLSVESLQSAGSSDYDVHARRSLRHGKQIHELTDTEFSPPAGPLLSRDEWLRLHAAARKRLDRFGYLMTQRDKRYLSRQSGIEVTAYIWSTLVSRMGLRRIKNPYTSSNLVLYVKSNQKK